MFYRVTIGGQGLWHHAASDLFRESAKACQFEDELIPRLTGEEHGRNLQFWFTGIGWRKFRRILQPILEKGGIPFKVRKERKLERVIYRDDLQVAISVPHTGELWDAEIIGLRSIGDSSEWSEIISMYLDRDEYFWAPEERIAKFREYIAPYKQARDSEKRERQIAWEACEEWVESEPDFPF